jgi:hypothetical protein
MRRLVWVGYAINKLLRQGRWGTELKMPGSAAD